MKMLKVSDEVCFSSPAAACAGTAPAAALVSTAVAAAHGSTACTAHSGSTRRQQQLQHKGAQERGRRAAWGGGRPRARGRRRMVRMRVGGGRRLWLSRSNEWSDLHESQTLEGGEEKIFRKMYRISGLAWDENFWYRTAHQGSVT